MIITNKTILQKGTMVCTSQKGHYNFYYPSDECYALTEDVEVKALNWIGSETHRAYETQNLNPNCVVWSETKPVKCEQ